MADITMCEGNNCPVKEKCHRYTAHANELWRSYANFQFERGGCAFFVDNKNYKKKEK